MSIDYSSMIKEPFSEAQSNFCTRILEQNRARWSSKQYEKFMRENAEFIEWFYVCSKFCLYEDFIREMAEYIHWDSVFEFQIYHLSRDFMLELIDNYDQFDIGVAGFDKDQTIHYMKRRLGETHPIDE